MRKTLVFSVLMLDFAAGVQATPVGSRATLAVLETTDLHANVLGYDYFKLAPDPSLGLERTATLIAQARREFPNTLLLDDGDAIQGSALADYQALAAPLPCAQTLAIYRAMNLIGYDGGTIGNHEFNYGLAYLNQVTGSRFQVDGVDPRAPRCAGPNFPLVLANIDSLRSGRPLFAPYRILTKTLLATGPDGQPLRARIKIGIIGFTPPAVLAWDKRWLDGRVLARGVRESAEKYIPEMRAQGAELIVALEHGGIDGAPYTPALENASLYLARVPGIDALLMGHAHQLFPNPASAAASFNLPDVDKVKGTVAGVPAVMANVWGKNLGVIGLRLVFDGKAWQVERGLTTVEARSTQNPDKSFVAPDPAIGALIAAEHAATIAYVRTPLGASDFRMSTYFSDVGDVSAIEIVNQAQAAYVADYVKVNLPQYAALPVLSLAAPFKSGAAGAGDYTDVPVGSLALNNAADLYLYPNTLCALKVNGAQLKAWLEKTAERFKRIDPADPRPQELIDPAFPGYNFDVATAPELSYEIDVTQAPGSRIRHLAYLGKEVGAEQPFLVATNSYRAGGGGNFPGLDGSKTVLAAPDANRDVLIRYIRAVRKLTRARNGAQRSWHFTPVATDGPVLFHSAPGGLELARAAGLRNVVLLKADDGLGKGYALYGIDLAR